MDGGGGEKRTNVAIPVLPSSNWFFNLHAVNVFSRNWPGYISILDFQGWGVRFLYFWKTGSSYLYWSNHFEKNLSFVLWLYLLTRLRKPEFVSNETFSPKTIIIPECAAEVNFIVSLSLK